MNNVKHKLAAMSKKQKISLSVIAASLIAGGLVVGCGSGGGDSTTTVDAFTPLTADPVVTGTDLFCDGVLRVSAEVAQDYNASQVIAYNVSATSDNDAARQNPNAANTLVRMGTITMPPMSSNGDVITDLTTLDINETKVHPLLISYAEQVFGTYELGDGSADIGDPTHYDDIFVSLSRDDGKTWKKYAISDHASQGKSSIKVTWNGQTIDYPAHAVKPTMVAAGNKILVAWHSKYCPSGNPLDLNQTTATDGTTTYPTDYFKVNGSQGLIDYEGIVAPNGKTVYEVPFSCIWTARGIMDTNETSETYGEITWMAPQQLTTGTRDAAKVTIAEVVPGSGAPVGFAISWQEDPEGLRSGKGEGPGDGWSGATTNHGADIWYSMITMDDFVLNDGVGTRPKPLNTFSYPVRITDNENCKVDDTKLYCQELCKEFGTVTDDNGKTYCKTGDVDMLTGEQVVLNGDTGASRPVIKLLPTTADAKTLAEWVVVLGYEETKGLSESEPGVPDQGTDSTDIALEGKSVYFETFPFKKLTAPTTQEEFDALVASLPMVSSGNIINQKVPRAVLNADGTYTQNTDDMIYENARRLTFIPQIDPCVEGQYTYGWLYKQGIFKQGDSSDMYVRFNDNFDATLTDAVNVSSKASTQTEVNSNLSDQSYVDVLENSFSPRGFIRGERIYIGFEYTPDYHPDSGYAPNNFYIRRYDAAAGGWQPAQNISQVDGNKLSTLDPRFFATPFSKYSTTQLESDKGDDSVLFMSFGTFDTSTGLEEDLYYTRSTDYGVTWEFLGTSGVTPTMDLASRDGIEEKEVQSLSTPDGTRLYNAWLQESATFTSSDHFSGLDTWFGKVNYNILNK